MNFPNETTIIYRIHATLRMAQRSIKRTEVEYIIRHGEIIELYEYDKPYPSRLLFGFADKRPLHVVVAWNQEDREWIVITVYEPDSTEWDENFKIRRTK